MSQTVQGFYIERRFRRRLYTLTVLMFIVIFCFVLKLASLQLLYGYENRVLAKKFVSHQEFTVAPRGLFFDRNYNLKDQPLVQNLRFVDFIINPDQFKNKQEAEKYVKTFSKVMGKNYENYRRFFEPKTWKQILRKNHFITLLERMTRSEHERIAVFRLANSKGNYAVKYLRHYSMGPAMAHVSGFIGLPSSKEISKKLALSYQTIGKDGLEAIYDSYLRGRDGIRVRHRTVNHEEQISTTQQGDNIVLTIEKKIQAAAYRALSSAGKAGAVVAMRAGTGEVIAMVSYPAFDPNILSSGNTKQRSQHIKNVRQHKAFLNLAVQAKFPPASLFKPLLALAALDNTKSNKIFTKDTSYQCRGSFTLKSSYASIPDTKFKCWGFHNHQNMIDAIANSCNVYFYNLGYQLGYPSIIKYSRDFGLDKATGIDLFGEVDGFVPDPNWKQRHLSNSWYDGDTVNLSIGQGFLQTTPLQIAVLYSALANRGKIYKPYLVKEIRSSIDNRRIKNFRPKLLREIPLSQSSLQVIHAGMRKAVTHGTARRLAYIPVPIAGKTGTAQTRSRKKSKDHAWFAGFAPFDAPIKDKIVVVVFVEYGLAGATTGVPIAAEIFKTTFSNWKAKKSRPDSDQNI